MASEWQIRNCLRSPFRRRLRIAKRISRRAHHIPNRKVPRTTPGNRAIKLQHANGVYETPRSRTVRFANQIVPELVLGALVLPVEPGLINGLRHDVVRQAVSMNTETNSGRQLYRQRRD